MSALAVVLDADTVIKRLSLQDLPDVRNAVESVLSAAHVVVQGVLQTTFELTTHSDKFFLDSGYYPVNPNGLMCCRLRQAFVQPNSVVVSATSESRKVAGTILDASDYEIDYVRGWVKVDEAYTDNWVQIAYTAGFDSTHKPPPWLEEAVLSYMPHLIAQPAGSFDTNAMNAANEAAKRDFEVMAKIVDPYLRASGFQFSPI